MRRIQIKLLNNLIENSRKYSKTESKIKIQLAHTKEYIRIELSDNGPGVPEEDLEKLLLPFYRPDEARTRQDGGTGLGLYLANNICKSHDGKLTLSNLNPGLKVTIELKKDFA
jgi:signal transduction histidine kinase